MRLLGQIVGFLILAVLASFLISGTFWIALKTLELFT